MQSSLSIFAQKYLRKCEDTYFILQNKYLCIYKDSFGSGSKILRDDWPELLQYTIISTFLSSIFLYLLEHLNYFKDNKYPKVSITRRMLIMSHQSDTGHLPHLARVFSEKNIPYTWVVSDSWKILGYVNFLQNSKTTFFP